MYVTRPLSMYRKFPSALSLPPPEGPNSGILVILDEEAERTCFFGLLKNHELKDLPFPQNKNLKVRHSEGEFASFYRVVLIPVLNQPLSSNRYYAIQPRGKHTGKAFTNSREEDMSTCCFCTFVNDIEPQPFDHQDIYQQVEIHRRNWPAGFVAKSVAPDGFPTEFLRRKGWDMTTSTPRNFKLGEAQGLDTNLRACLPDFNFSVSHTSAKPVVVGKWYCPFMFIKDGTLKDQTSSSMYYEMTLEQRWEQIFVCDNNHNEDNVAVVDVAVQREVVAIAGREVVHDERNVVNGVMWFRGFSDVGGEVSVGLSLPIIERMKWEQERFGWIGGQERQVRVKRVEKFEGMGEWRKFGCYVLVERFVLKRMDGSLVLTYDFKHANQIRCKWE